MLIRKYQHIFVSCKIDKGLTFHEKLHILTRIPSSECHFWFKPEYTVCIKWLLSYFAFYMLEKSLPIKTLKYISSILQEWFILLSTVSEKL